MSPTGRIASFGSAGLCVICGAVCAAVVGGELGQLLGMVLIGLGLILAIAFVFMEVGLSEDRERRREQAEADREQTGRRVPVPSRLKRPDLGRSRGHRRRLS